ncbi:MAG: M48 family metalloprotease [bacterium]|nr:M48 family metalloprotease [bacterium]
MSVTSQDFIKQQNLKVYVFMGLLTFILGSLGTVISYHFKWGLTGTGVFLLFSAIINFYSYFFSHKLILKMSNAKPVERHQVPELFGIVEELSLKLQIPVPKIYVINDDAMNAFATGRDQKHAVVAVSRGLLEKLDLHEVKGVVGHELTHIENGDMRLMTITTMLAGFVSILADMYWYSMRVSSADSKDRSGYLAMIGFILSLAAPLSAMLIQLAISRKREFIADAGSAEVTGEPSALANALEKISRDMRPLPSVGVSTAHLYFSNPSKGGDLLDKLFSTHPPVAERIKALQMIKGA